MKKQEQRILQKKTSSEKDTRKGTRRKAVGKGRYVTLRIPSLLKEEMEIFLDILADWHHSTGSRHLHTLSSGGSHDKIRRVMAHRLEMMADYELERQMKQRQAEEDRLQLNLFDID